MLFISRRDQAFSSLQTKIIGSLKLVANQTDLLLDGFLLSRLHLLCCKRTNAQ